MENNIEKDNSGLIGLLDKMFVGGMIGVGTVGGGMVAFYGEGNPLGGIIVAGVSYFCVGIYYGIKSQG